MLGNEIELLIDLTNNYNTFVEHLNNFDIIFDSLNTELDRLDQFTKYKVDTIYTSSVEQNNNALTDDYSTFNIDSDNKIKIEKVTSISPLDNSESLKKLYTSKLRNTNYRRYQLKANLDNMKRIKNVFTANGNQSCATNFCTTNLNTSVGKFNQIESKILSSLTSKHVPSGNIFPRLGR